ncbi:MAG: GumC family protein [Pleurocapsa sp.]
MKINSQNVSIATEKFAVDPSEEQGLNLNEIKEIIGRRIPLILLITISTSILGVIKVSSNPSIYSGYFEIFSEPVTIETIVSSSSDTRMQETKEQISAVKLDQVQLKVLTSPKLLNPVVEELQPKYPTINYGHLIKELKLKPNENDNVLEVSYSAPDEQQVMDVLQTISQTYLDYSLQSRQSGVNRGIEFLEVQIPELRSEVEELQQQKEKLQKKYMFGDFVTRGEHLTNRLNQLGSQQQDNRAELSQLKNSAVRLEQELAQKLTTSTTAFEVATYRYNQLIQRLENVDSQIALRSAVLSELNPEIQVLYQQKANIINLIEQESNTIRDKINKQIQQLEERDRIYTEDMADIGQQIQQWSSISNDYDIIQGQLELASQKLQESIIQRNSFLVDAAQKQAPWSLLTPVNKSGVNSASLINSGVLGASLGLLVGMGIAITLEKLEDKIYNTSKIKQIANLPILGMIPFESASQKKLLQHNHVSQSNTNKRSETPDSAIQTYRNHPYLQDLISSSVEAFRFSGANLGLFDADNPLQSILVTSAVTGEGKTSVAFNLAKTVAELGQRVLIVDTDMHSQNSMSDRLKLSNVSGLSDFLLENYLELHHLIQKLPIEENLYVLTTGNLKTKSDPSRLLASTKMQKLNTDLKAHFDLIIYDVAPLVDYADVSLLKTIVDGVILVTGLGKLQSTKLEQALTQLAIANLPVLGVVINQVTSTSLIKI